MIKISHLQKKYPNVTPLKDVNVEIHKGDVISIIGPSGTGKSTLIRCINMLETPTAGEIWVDGECITDKKCNINKIRQKMGMVFQSFNLFNHMNIFNPILHDIQEEYPDVFRRCSMASSAAPISPISTLEAVATLSLTISKEFMPERTQVTSF